LVVAFAERVIMNTFIRESLNFTKPDTVKT
jgi:hypothetical protein